MPQSVGSGSRRLVKEVISRGKYAEVLSDARSLSEEESELFDRQAQFAYESFRNKAASSRGKTPEDMETYAQVRVGRKSDVGGHGVAKCAAEEASVVRHAPLCSL